MTITSTGTPGTADNSGQPVRKARTWIDFLLSLALAARHILPGVYATDSQVPQSADKRYEVGPEISVRLDDAVLTLLAESFRLPATAGFEPVHFSRVRCSV